MEALHQAIAGKRLRRGCCDEAPPCLTNVVRINERNIYKIDCGEGVLMNEGASALSSEIKTIRCRSDVCSADLALARLSSVHLGT